MNSLVFFKEEKVDGIVRLTGSRAQHARERHDPKVGVRLPVGEWAGMRGYGVFTEVGREEIALRIELTEPPLVRAPVEIICAVARPQTVKKVIHAAVTCGVEILHFVKSSEVEKSYFQSSALGEKEIRDEILLGLEQACDTIPPTIQIHERFKPFVEDILAARIRAAHDPIAAMLDTETVGSGYPSIDQFAARIAKGTSRAFCAIGPERGWSEHERQAFLKLDLCPISLGPRILRVETATTAAAVFLSELFRRRP